MLDGNNSLQSRKQWFDSNVFWETLEEIQFTMESWLASVSRTLVLG
jgi:hypothetical protein